MVSRAKSHRVELLFLTDHDSVTGFPEAETAAREKGVSVRCGIEINTCQADQVHILGYGLRWRDPAFVLRLEEFRSRREKRARLIVEKLQGLGLDIRFSDVQAASHETLGRPHVADALRRKKIVHSRQEAFNRYLMGGKPGYVPPMGPTPEEAITLIRDAGGFSSLAHPESVKDLGGDLPRWVEMGLGGLEVYYAAHGPSAREKFTQLAARYGLVATGGSDFHGPGSGRDFPLGVEIPDEVFAVFLERLDRCN